MGAKFFVSVVSCDFERVPHGDVTRFHLRVLKFVLHVFFQDVKIELLLPTTVETEATDFAFGFSHVGFVGVIFRPCRGEFHNVISWFQLVGKFSEVVAEREFGLTGFPVVNETVGVKVQHLFWVKLFDTFVQFETGPAGGETCNENINVDLNGGAFVLMVVHHFQHFFVDDSNTVNVFGIVSEEVVKFAGGREPFHLTFVGLLAELAPEGV